MSVKVMSLVWEAELGSPTRKLVALKLADCANDRGESIYPSIATICAVTELSRRTVTRALDDMRRDGLLRVTRRGGGTCGPTRYRMNLAWLYERIVGVPGGVTVTPGGVTRAQNPSGEPREPSKVEVDSNVVGSRAARKVREPDISANPLDAWGRE